MAKGLITRRGGVGGEPTPPPSINFVSATLDSITFTITNNSVSARDIVYGLTTPPEDETLILGGLATSDEITITGLEDGTSYTFYAQTEDSAITETILQTLTWEPIQATGGTITQIGDYRYHAFTSTGTATFSVQDTGTDAEVDVLVVAGGGGGGTRHAGGGGAGGLLTNIGGTPLQINAQNYTITVGAGGAGGLRNGIRPSGTTSRGRNGLNSSAFNFTAIGGGGGGGGTSGVSPGSESPLPQTGGSGGGGSTGDQQGASGTSGQGSSGGNGRSTQWSGGGGGGKGGSGISASSSGVGGNGGQGFNLSSSFPNWGTNSSNTTTGTRGWFASGGAGASAYGTHTYIAGTSSAGGGANGGASNASGSNAINNTGGGGGGGGNEENGANGGAGGSGIVLVRYPLTKPN